MCSALTNERSVDHNKVWLEARANKRARWADEVEDHSERCGDIVEFKAAGVSFHASGVKALSVGDWVKIERDLDNEFDETAIKLSKASGSAFGYVPTLMKRRVESRLGWDDDYDELGSPARFAYGKVSSIMVVSEKAKRRVVNNQRKRQCYTRPRRRNRDWDDWKEFELYELSSEEDEEPCQLSTGVAVKINNLTLTGPRSHA